MKINTFTEFHGFMIELNLYDYSTREFLHNIYTKKDRDFYILDIEKREVFETSQTFSLDNDWVSHVEERESYELYLETLSTLGVRNTTVLTFKSINNLEKIDQFIKDNFKFLKRYGLGFYP